MTIAISAFTVLDVATVPPDLPPGARLADVVLDGGLRRYLRRARIAESKSWFAIAVELKEISGGAVRVTGPTVRDWWDRLGLDDEGEAEATA